MNNDRNNTSKIEFFELREKRLKLVYRILYVVVAIWIAVILNLASEKLTATIIPFYSFILLCSSLFIIKIIKYALMEFRCMKVTGKVDESLLQQTEDRYDGIWKSFSVVLSDSALLMLLQMQFSSVVTQTVLLYMFFACIVYFMIVSILEMFKNNIKDGTIKVLDTISLFVGIITAYSISSVMCMVMAK